MLDGDIQMKVFPTNLQLSRVDPEQNMRRFYRLKVQHDLFGGVSLIRVWGRIGTRGRQRIDTHADEGGAISALMKLAQQKQRRGYIINSHRFY